MQFGSFTVHQWHHQLSTPQKPGSAPPSPQRSPLRPDPSPADSVKAATSSLPPLSWAARVAGVASSSPDALPTPRDIPNPSSHSDVSLKPSTPSLAHHPAQTQQPNDTTEPNSKSSLRKPVHSPRRRRRSHRNASRTIPLRRIRGLINGGNCCFINVVLQALLACEAFRSLLYDCLDALPDSLIFKFVRLTRDIDGSICSAPNCDSYTQKPDSNVNGKVHLSNGNSDHTRDDLKYTGAEQDQKRSTHVKNTSAVRAEPLLADWFYDVFPSSTGVGGHISQINKGGVNSESEQVNDSHMKKISNGRSNAVGGSMGGGGSQEDAEEFLTFILNALHEEMVEWDDQLVQGSSTEKDSWSGTMNTIGDEHGFHAVEGRIHAMNGRDREHNADNDNVWTEMTRRGKAVEIRGGEFAQSGVTDIFGGALRSEVKRGRGGKASVTREPFFSLSLDIENGLIRDVEQAVGAYFEPEHLEGYAEQGMNGQVTSVEAKKQVLLMQCPEMLILHLKRFSHNSVTGALNKVSRQIMFPQVLTVPGKVMHNAGSRWGNEDGKRYELRAVVTHVGKELAGGHYTADVWWNDGWWFCDDSKIVETSWAKVSRKQAYLLFYGAL